MIEDDLPLKFRNAEGAAALIALTREDLDPYSVEDLATRVTLMEGEIKRIKAALERKKNRLSDADALFSFKGS